MDMERLMNTVYPLEKVNEIWPFQHCGHMIWDRACRYGRGARLHELQGRRLATCSNLYPVEAYPGSDKGLAR